MIVHVIAELLYKHFLRCQLKKKKKTHIVQKIARVFV